MPFDIQMLQVEGKEKARQIIAYTLIIFVVILLSITTYIGYDEYVNGTGNYAFCGEKFTKCEMARLLYTHGIPLHLINDWVCLVKYESQLRTNIVGGPNKDGSLNYGLFQISGENWCGLDKPGKGCNVTCESLVTDVDVSISCAKKVYEKLGFNAWVAWEENCKNKKKNDFTHCITRGLNATTESTQNSN